MASFYSKNSTAYNQILGGTANDDNYIFGINNFGTYTIAASSRNNSLDLSALTSSLIVNLTSSAGHEVSDGVGNYINWLNNTIYKITTGSGNDNITGNIATNYIDGGIGNDSIYAGAGNDSLIGGNGNDLLDGGTGNDTYIFAAGFGLDSILDASGTDTLNFANINTPVIINLTAGAGDEVVNGINTINWTGNIIENITTGWGNDTLVGNSLSNTLIADYGNDILNGGAGNDVLDGGGNDDTYVFANNWGSDTIRELMGTDTIDLGAVTTDLNIKLTFSSSTSQVVSGSNSVRWNNASIENAIAGSGNDSIIGSTAENLFKGGAGNDTILAGGGNDSIWGDAGNDILKGESGSDIYYFENNWGVDTIEDNNLSYDVNTLNLSAITKNLTINLTGTTFANEVSDGVNTINWLGSSIQNLISGSGNDTISGNNAKNLLNGNLGDDTYVKFAGNFSNDTIVDSSGYDILNLSQYNKGTDAVLSRIGNDLFVNINKLNVGKGTILIKDYYNNDVVEEIVFANTTMHVNRAPTNISFASGGSIDENSNNGAILGNLSTTDPDEGQTYTYSLLDNAGGRFSLSSSGELKVANGFLLDYEKNTTHNITVRSTDEGGLYVDKVLSVSVNDVFELPSFTNSNLSANLNSTGRHVLSSSELSAQNITSNNFTYIVSSLSNNLNIEKWNGDSWTNLGYAQNTLLNVQGSLEAGDATFSNGAYNDGYQITIKAGTSLQIDQVSDFDDYLILTDSNNKTLAFNDDGGLGDNSSIYYTNNTGSDISAIIYATAYDGSQTGNYTLTATSFTPQNTISFSNTDLQNGLIAISDNRGSSLLLNIDDTLSNTDSTTNPLKLGNYNDSYQVTIKAGTTIQIAQYSPDFDTYLQLVNNTGNTLLVENDDAGNSNNSFISYANTTNSDIQATIYATSYAENETGYYTLKATSIFTQQTSGSSGFNILIDDNGNMSGNSSFTVNIDVANIVLNGDHFAHSSSVGNQYNPAIGSLSNGNFVTLWADYESSSNIKGTIFNSDGIALNDSFTINSGTGSSKAQEEVTALANGGFAVTWNDYNGSNWDIKARVFDASGNALNANDLTISTSNNATTDQMSPQITTLANGNFAITWEDYNPSLANYDIRGRVYNSSGTAINGSDFLISNTNTGTQNDPDITALSGGNFVVSWTDYSAGVSNANIRARVYNSSGTAVNASNLLISSTNTNNQMNSQVSDLTNGNFVVVWEDYSAGTSNADIRARVYNSSGTAINGADFLVSTTNTDNQLNPQVADLSNGNFLVVWEDYSSGGSNSDIRGRIFNSSGTAINASDFLVSTSNYGVQSAPEITTLTNGGFVVSWNNYDNGYSVRARVFNADGSFTADNTYDFSVSALSTNAPFHRITALDNGGFAVTWSSNTDNDSNVKMATFDSNGYIVISGSTGNDILNSEYYSEKNTYFDSSPQVLAGGAGNDVYIMQDLIGNDTIRDASGTDSLDLTAYAFNALSDPFSRVEGGASGDDLLINLGSNGSITIQNYFNEAGTAAGTGYIENIDFANHHDITVSTLLTNAWV